MLSVEEKVKVKVKVTESQYNLSSHTPETCNEERKKVSHLHLVNVFNL